MVRTLLLLLRMLDLVRSILEDGRWSRADCTRLNISHTQFLDASRLVSSPLSDTPDNMHRFWSAYDRYQFRHA